MFNVKTIDKTLSFVFSSRLDMVDRLIPLVLEYLEDLDETGNSELLRVVIRELLCNAIEHGNKLDHTKVVTGQIDQLEDHRYRCSISDEGEGIDEAQIYFESTPDAQRGRNMGYSIINSYSDEIKISGSTVIVYVTLPINTSFSVEHTENGTTITPNGDISAAISEKFREILINWLDSPSTNLTVDFKNVESIDSISLGTLVSFHRLLIKQDDSRKIVFINISQPLMYVFRLTQIHTMYHIEQSNSEHS